MTDSITNRPLTATHVTPEGLMDGRIELRAWIPDPAERIGARSQSVIVDHDAAWSLFTNLASLLHYQSGERMRSAVAGDCATCGNHRMVDKPTSGGRTELVHCPDCHDRYAEAKPAYPAPPEAD